MNVTTQRPWRRWRLTRKERPSPCAECCYRVRCSTGRPCASAATSVPPSSTRSQDERTLAHRQRRIAYRLTHICSFDNRRTSRRYSDLSMRLCFALQQTWIQLESFSRSHKDLPLSPTIRAYPTAGLLLRSSTAAEIPPTARTATPRISKAATLDSPRARSSITSTCAR